MNGPELVTSSTRQEGAQRSAVRDVQLSAFPDLQVDKPVGGIIGSVFTGSNADLMAAVSPLYLTGSVMDCTYGEGKWWTRYRPADLICHDLDTTKGDGVSFLALPEADDSVDTVTFDPPYIPAGGKRTSGQTEAEANFRNRFGLDPMSRADLLELVHGGMAEACRVARSYVLAKCTDYVSARAFWLGHLDMIAAAANSGWVVHDLIIHATGSGPGGHNIYEVLRARRAHSYLVVFVPGPSARPSLFGAPA